MPFTSKVPWRQKIEQSAPPRIVEVAPGRSRAGDGKMLISSPLEIEEVVKSIPKGSFVTIGELRKILSDRVNADFTCPITTGIFLKIVAYAADDEILRTGEGVAYWRVVQNSGNLNEGFPGGALRQAHLLRSEGVNVVHDRRNRLFVRPEARQLT